MSARNPPPVFFPYRALRSAGMSRSQIDAAVRSGTLERVRRGRYVPAAEEPRILEAARLGGRLDCVSLLRHLGVFVLHHDRLHLQLSVGASRLPPRPETVVPHWRHTSARADELVTGIVEALVQACLCQPPRAAIATLDSAWHQHLIDADDIAEIFARLPRRMQRLRRLVDRRSESGPESFVRLMLRAVTRDVVVQPWIEGVGRVDFAVDGWLIVECDSREFHGSWAAQREDRRRDLAAAAAGFVTFRVIAEDVMYRPDVVAAALRQLLRAHNSFDAASKRPRRPAAAGI